MIAAIIGRPNVGKSTLFNKLIGKRLAIVDDVAGVTRDRLHAVCTWNGVDFSLVDTGGISDESAGLFPEVREQALYAMECADVVVQVVDGSVPMTTDDEYVAGLLARSGKECILAVNKCDNGSTLPSDAYDYYALGMEPVFVSALHGMGTGDLLDLITANAAAYEVPPDDALRIAIVGKPNVGKSSLVNHICGENRVIVSSIAGTTRDAIDTPVERDGEKYILIDTAGMRKKGKVVDIERYSVLRGLSAIDRADVVIHLIDATEGPSEQDSKITGYAHDAGKAIVVAVNKWDAVEKETNTMRDMRFEVQEELPFMLYAPVLFISAKTGRGVGKLLEMARHVWSQSNMRISTSMFNELLADATARVQPPSDKGRRLRIYYGTQVSVKPPTFRIFVNDERLAHYSYTRYLENRLRDTYGFEGTAIRLHVVGKRKEDNPFRPHSGNNHSS